MNRPRRHRRIRLTAGVALLTAAALLAGCSEPESEVRLRRALRRDGLEICSARVNHDGNANQAVSTTTLVVAESCASGDTATIVLDRFRNSSHRNAAAFGFQGQLRPRGDGVVWEWGPFTAFVFGPRDDAVVDRITEVMDRIGAA